MSSKQRKRPFRVRLGSVVALRDNAASGDTVWAPPLAERDLGLALVGRRVRCHLPKVSETQQKTRLVGQVLKVGEWKRGKPIKVELLVDEADLADFSFLKRIDEKVDVSQMTEKARKYHELEELIRGPNKAVVLLKLVHPHYREVAESKILWEVEKMIPQQLLPATVSNGNGDSMMHAKKSRVIGDKTDSREQKRANWQWLACHLNDWSQKECLDRFLGEVVSMTSKSVENTLAMVTLRKLVVPEQTSSGRLRGDAAHALYYVGEATVDIPIERLIVVASKLNPQEGDDADDFLFAKEYYDPKTDAIYQRPPINGDTSSIPCHSCRRTWVRLADPCVVEECKYSREANESPRWCSDCAASFALDRLPCCSGSCDCHDCQRRYTNVLHESFQTGLAAMGEVESSTLALESVGSFAFGLPSSFFGMPSADTPATKEQVSNSTSKPTKVKSAQKAPKNEKSAGQSRKRKNSGVGEHKTASTSTSAEDYSIFKPSLARSMEYGTIRKHTDFHGDLFLSDVPRNLRQEAVVADKKDTKEEVASRTGRAARANQRRLLKDVATMGAFGLGIDTLSTRESQLRFDRSGIHAWGVFADRDIPREEMIVEYRGEVIGNSVAERREKEYEAAKIGSDYMFRIDGESVCDATKQGNVARFINASCDPNCYTKIITLDGEKRIVIYSKRDISAGEELCYDYKFPLEFDETRRIPCHCGARDCRGFMNWDRRYVAIAPLEPTRNHLKMASAEGD